MFGDPELQNQTGVVGIHAIIYALKYSVDRRSVLVSKTPSLSADKIGEQVIGWIPAVMLQEIGHQVFTGTAFSRVAGFAKDAEICSYDISLPYRFHLLVRQRNIRTGY